ncbi:MAG TPA: 4'-phosphopantetheinyl transferase superfamily protein [Candidatus Binatia bacterium]|nr:4'-phosphopantetheinyl transferase superfamily protein [Candidatus Binatia bacterium]
MLNQLWVRPSSLSGLILKENEVHVWLVQAGDESIYFKIFEDLLSPTERDRAARFKFETDRRRYVIAHAALRSILSLYVKRPAQELQFVAGPNGKPKLALVHANNKLEFNLSHSHEVSLIAVTEGREIGVDVEWVKEDFAFGEVAQRFFTGKEVAELKALPTELQRRTFYRCWSSKEAFLKAKGTGLSGELDEVEILFTPGEDVRISGTIPNWTLIELNPSDGYVGALATEGSKCRLECFQWRSSLTSLSTDRDS